MQRGVTHSKTKQIHLPDRRWGTGLSWQWSHQRHPKWHCSISSDACSLVGWMWWLLLEGTGRNVRIPFYSSVCQRQKLAKIDGIVLPPYSPYSTSFQFRRDCIWSFGWINRLTSANKSSVPFLCAGFRPGQPDAALGGLLDILGMCPSMGTGLCRLVLLDIWISVKQSGRRRTRF